MTSHPDEGAFHALVDGELSRDEAAALEQHAAECARCAAALAEARGLAAAASRVVSALDAAPTAARSGASRAAASAASSARRSRFTAVRIPYARAAALLLLAGGTAAVLSRTAPGERDASSPESATLAAAAPAAPLPGSVSDSSVPVAEPNTSVAVVAGQSRPAPRAASPLRAPASRVLTSDGRIAGRVTSEADFSGRGVAGGVASAEQAAAPFALRSPPVPSAGAVSIAPDSGVSRAAMDHALAAPPSPPLAAPSAAPRAPSRVTRSGAVVAGAMVEAPSATRITRYRLENGVILTLTDEPLRASFAADGESQRKVSPATPMAASGSAVNVYRWHSRDLGRSYTLAGPLTVTELEAAARRLAELERLP